MEQEQSVISFLCSEAEKCSENKECGIRWLLFINGSCEIPSLKYRTRLKPETASISEAKSALPSWCDLFLFEKDIRWVEV